MLVGDIASGLKHRPEIVHKVPSAAAARPPAPDCAQLRPSSVARSLLQAARCLLQVVCCMLHAAPLRAARRLFHAARRLLHQFGLEMHPETEFAATYGARKAITFRFGIGTLGLGWALYAVRHLQPRWRPSASRPHAVAAPRCHAVAVAARFEFGGACACSGGSFQSQSTRSTAYE